jgi:hypothetical protein
MATATKLNNDDDGGEVGRDIGTKIKTALPDKTAKNSFNDRDKESGATQTTKNDETRDTISDDETEAKPLDKEKLLERALKVPPQKIGDVPVDAYGQK